MLKQLKNNFRAYASIVLIILSLNNTLKSQEKNITLVMGSAVNEGDM